MQEGLLWLDADPSASWPKGGPRRVATNSSSVVGLTYVT
jgi:hypothetical protein